MKQRRYVSLWSVVITAILMAGPSWAVAIQWKEQPLLTWENEAITAFELNDYGKVIELSKSQKNDPNRNGHLLIYFAHAQKYYMEHNKTSAVYYKQHYQSTLNRLNAANLSVLCRLSAMEQLDWNKKINKLFLKSAFEKIKSEEYLGPILYYISQPDSNISKAAMKGLHSILEKKRTIVMNGGTLESKDRNWISDPKLIKLLAKKTGEKVSPMTGLLSKLPSIARKKVMGEAQACLVLIEEPALPILKEAASMGNPNAAATIKLVNEARSKRMVEYPGSTWYSATGQ